MADEKRHGRDIYTSSSGMHIPSCIVFRSFGRHYQGKGFNGNVKYFVSARKNILYPIAYVLIKKDCIEYSFHAGFVLEDPHGPCPPPYFPEDPFYGIGRPYLPSEGGVGKAKEGEQVIEIVPQALHRRGVDVLPGP